MESKKNDINELILKTHSHRKQTYGYQRVEEGGLIMSLGLTDAHYCI